MSSFKKEKNLEKETLLAIWLIEFFAAHWYTWFFLVHLYNKVQS